MSTRAPGTYLRQQINTPGVSFLLCFVLCSFHNLKTPFNFLSPVIPSMVERSHYMHTVSFPSSSSPSYLPPFFIHKSTLIISTYSVALPDTLSLMGASSILQYTVITLLKCPEWSALYVMRSTASLPGCTGSWG